MEEFKKLGEYLAKTGGFRPKREGWNLLETRKSFFQYKQEYSISTIINIFSSVLLVASLP